MLYELTVPQFIKTLNQMKTWFDKAQAHAEAKKFDVQVLTQTRLVPDQFPLIRQVQIACDTAKLCAARLTGKNAPVHEDKEVTFDDLRTRIDSVVTYLKTFSAKDFVDAEGRRVTQPRWEGKYMLGFEFLTQHTLPNFYFHTTTAYAILRHCGVEVGKRDFLGEMPYKH